MTYILQMQELQEFTMLMILI